MGAENGPIVTRTLVNRRQRTGGVQGILCFRCSRNCGNVTGGRSGNFLSDQGIAVSAPGLLRSSSGNPVYWYEGGGGASRGLSGEYSVPAGGDAGCRCW